MVLYKFNANIYYIYNWNEEPGTGGGVFNSHYNNPGEKQSRSEVEQWEWDWYMNARIVKI